MQQLTEKLTLQIGGMSCGHCTAQVERALRGVPGAEVEHVAVGSATVAFDPARTNPEALAAAVAEAGYSATVDSTGTRG